MRVTSAIFTKQAKDMLKNPSILVMFIVFPAVAFIMTALVRIPELRREHVLKCAEMGAAGLLLPNTETAEQSRALVDYAKYAPEGRRGVSLSRPHTDFRKISDGEAYMREANENILLICQIESREGVKNINDRLNVNGIGAAMIGPNDLTQDMGILNQFDHPETVRAFEKVIEAANGAGKVSGVHFGSAGPLKKWIEKGMRLNMCGSDCGLMQIGAARQREELGGIYASKNH
jgi:2-dehydro-3-deoxyglucarate aldolase/4-hydroxy-2-oxoheptanedioate aldolase